MSETNDGHSASRHCTADLATAIKVATKECEKYDACTEVSVSRRGASVTLNTDTSRATYSESIPGIVGGDCGLIRDMETDEVIGIKLELKTDKLAISHDGPLRVNSGFRKSDCP